MAKNIYLGLNRKLVRLVNLIQQGALTSNGKWTKTGTSRYSYTTDSSTGTTMTVTSSTNLSLYKKGLYQQIKGIAGDTTSTRYKIYVRGLILSPTTNTVNSALYYRYNTTDAYITGNKNGQWTTLSTIVDTYSQGTFIEIGFGFSATPASNDTISCKQAIVINLTEVFGRGNEPTKDWCDNNIPFFNTNTIIDLSPDYSVANNINNLYIGVNNVARKVKRGYIGINNIAKRFYNRFFTWKKYNLLTRYNEIISSTDNSTRPGAFYAGSTYSFDNTTGQFIVDQDQSITNNSSGATDAIGKYFININNSSSLGVTGSTLGLITDASYNWLTGLSITYDIYTSEEYKIKGTFNSTVSSWEPNSYIINGIDGDYWYEMDDLIPFTYTGNYINEVVLMEHTPYQLITLTSSGTLTFESSIIFDMWACGGGGNGQSSSGSVASRNCTGGRGGGGAYAITENNLIGETLTVTIGAAGVTAGNTLIVLNDITYRAKGGNRDTSTDVGETSPGYGGTGGGGTSNWSGTYAPGSGDDISKLPFNSSYFPYPYCDGGGGGTGGNDNHYLAGGFGGSNGRSGTTKAVNNDNNLNNGGGYYGGNCGYTKGTSAQAATPGTGYGSGGGGGSRRASSDDSGYETAAAASGYQGVVFIRIPL